MAINKNMDELYMSIAASRQTVFVFQVCAVRDTTLPQYSSTIKHPTVACWRLKGLSAVAWHDLQTIGTIVDALVKVKETPGRSRCIRSILETGGL